MGGMSGQNVENSELVMIFDETQVISGNGRMEGVILKSGGLAKGSRQKKNGYFTVRLTVRGRGWF